MKIIEFMFLLIFFKSTTALLFNGNSTWKDFVKCKEFDVSDGYNYRQFFRIDEFTQKAATELSDDTMINIEIAVLAIRDAHILLAPSASPNNETPVYEIVIGAGSNTFSEIRRFKKKSPLKTKSTQNILSVIRPIPINIVYKRLGETGRIDVYTNGEPFPLLSYDDPSIIDIKYISFCSWGSAEAKWFYDCESHENSSTNSLAPEPRKLTPIKELKKRFWDLAQFHLDPPTNKTQVMYNIEIEQLDYSLQDFSLMFRGRFNFQWHDFRNVWDPEEYENIKIYRGSLPIWYPNLLLINGKTKDTELDTGFRYVIYNNGSVEAMSKPIELNTLCLTRYRKISWPNDDQSCNIVLSSPSEFIHFDWRKRDKYSSNKWNITRVYSYTSMKLPFPYNITSTNTKNYNKINLLVYFQRNQDFFGKLFFTPLIVSLILIELSFWIEHPYRCGINLLAIVMQVGVFLAISQYAPHDYVPTIVRYYHLGIYFTWISIIFTIISLWYTKHPPENPPKLWILDIMDNKIVRIVLGERHLETNDDINGRQLPWIELTKIFDRILFILIGMVILAVLFQGY